MIRPTSPPTPAAFFSASGQTNDLLHSGRGCHLGVYSSEIFFLISLLLLVLSMVHSSFRPSRVLEMVSSSSSSPDPTVVPRFLEANERGRPFSEEEEEDGGERVEETRRETTRTRRA